MSSEDIEKIISSDTLRDERVPPGQHVVHDWPELHFDGVPPVDLNTWRLRVFGMVDEEVVWTWDELQSLPHAEVHADWHCVTTWTMLDMRWIGVTSRELLKHVKFRPEAKAVMIHSVDKYTTNLPIEDFLDNDVIIAWAEGGKDLEPGKGGPVRLVVPKLYAWKSAKWLSGIEFIPENVPGYWETRGYHLRGDPWEEERHEKPLG